MRVSRGIAVGTAIAIIVLVAITAYAMYKLWETYSVAYRSITEYAVAAQKPTFKITSITNNGTNVIVTVTNLGPTAVTVEKVHVYKYVYSSVPNGVYTPASPRNKYVPVGGSFEIALPMDKINEYVAYGSPLRMLIETDRGMVLIGMNAPVTDAVINVILPDYVYPNWQNPPYVQIDCENAGGPIIAVSLYTHDTDIASVSCNGHTCTIFAKVWGVGKCRVSLGGSIMYRGVHTKWPEEPAKNILIRGIVVNQQLSELGVVSEFQVPSTSPVIDIKLPELLAVQKPAPIAQNGYTQIIDFSWYFIPIVHSGTATGSVERVDPYQTALALVKNGAVLVTSPAGCRISPSDGDSQTIINKINDLVYRFQWEGQTGNNYAIHTGLPIVIQNYPDSCTNLYAGNGTIMDIAIPLYLSNGKYIIIPVLSYNDEGDYLPTIPPNTNTVPTNVTAYIVDPNGKKIGTWIAGDVYTYDPGITQMASPIIVNAGSSGTYYLHIVVKDDNIAAGKPTGHADWLYIILSKVVVIRAGEYSSVCAYQVPLSNVPTFPWAVVDLKTGSVERTAKIIFNPLEYATSSDIASKAPKLALYSLGYKTEGVLRFTPTTLDINGFKIDDVRPHYIAPGYSVTVSVSTTTNPSFLESYVLAGSSADDPASYSIFYYPDYPLVQNMPGIMQMPSIVTLVSNADSDDVSTDVSITFGEPGVHYVIIGLSYNPGYYPYNEYPSFTITGVSSYSVIYPSTIINGRYSLKNDHGDSAEIVIWVDASAGDTMTIHFYNGINRSPDNLPPESVTALMITHIIVVKDPSLTPSIIAPNGAQSTLPGLYLTDVEPIPGVNFVNAFLVRTDNGAPVASWTFSPPQGQTSTVLLSMLGFNSIVYSLLPLDLNTDKGLLEYPQYTLLVYGAECQGNVVTGANPGGTTGGSSSSGGSTTPTIRWYRTEIDISSNTAKNGYQVEVVLGSTWDGWSIGAKEGSIYFKDANGNPLYFWVQSWDSTAKKAVIWVKANIVAGTTKIYMYWSPDTSTRPSQYSGYDDPNNVFLFFDNFETWSGWKKYLNGVVSQDTKISFEGSASLLKNSYCDPSGGYKMFTTPIPAKQGLVLEAWVYRTRLSGCNADRFGLISGDPYTSGATGYGPAIGHGSTTTTISVEGRYVYWGGYVSSFVITPQRTITGSLLNQWLHVKMIWDYTPTRTTVSLYVYGSNGKQLGYTSGAATRIPNQFAGIYVFGGYPYNLDLVFIHYYVPGVTVSVVTPSQQVS